MELRERMGARPARAFAKLFFTSFVVAATSGIASADSCLDDAFGSATSCTANDFGVATVMITSIVDDGCQFTGDTITFDGLLKVGGGNSARYDVGFYIASDSVQALSGQCTVAIVPPGSGSADDGDACGDFDGSPLAVPVSGVTVACADGDSDGFYDLVICASYTQSSGSDCQGPADAVPGTSSKCNCQRVVTEEPVPPCVTNADCTDDGNPCTDEVCNDPQSGIGDSSGCSHEANTASCDDGLFCNGAEACSDGLCRHQGNPCTVCVESCDEEGDACSAAADPEACTAQEICRGPSYWGSRGGSEGEDAVNVVQDVLDAVGGVEVCGNWVDKTVNAESPWVWGLHTDSALQGMCVRTKGVKQRRLHRELVAAALNCAVSGRDDCDTMLEGRVDVSFSECNDLCAVNSDDNPSLNKCIRELACFNDGGEIVDGKCARGTCETQSGIYCGAEHPDCPLVDEQPQKCLRFDDSCRDTPLCNEALGVCPLRSEPSSRSACREAKRDLCTIDACS